MVPSNRSSGGKRLHERFASHEQTRWRATSHSLFGVEKHREIGCCGWCVAISQITEAVSRGQVFNSLTTARVGFLHRASMHIVT